MSPALSFTDEQLRARAREMGMIVGEDIDSRTRSLAAASLARDAQPEEPLTYPEEGLTVDVVVRRGPTVVGVATFSIPERKT